MFALARCVRIPSVRAKFRISFNSVSLPARKQQPKILAKITSIIKSGIYLNGEENKILSNNLARYFPNRLVTLCGSGHDALYLALSSLNLRSFDEVIFPVNAYPTAFPVALTCAKAIPIDVDRNGLLDFNLLDKCLTRKTKAIILVHLYGLVCDIGKVKKIIKGRKITLIEDCAQSFGSCYQGKQVGTIGDIGCFSFYPTKNVGTLGDGGFLLTRHKRYDRYFKRAVSYGETVHYQSRFVSFHSRLPEIQAGIINVLFNRVTGDFAKRQTLTSYYRKKIISAGLTKFIKILESCDYSSPVVHLFVIAASKRDQLRCFLVKRGIPTAIHYPKPVHLIKAFSHLKLKKGDFPQAEKLSRQILSLPFSPYITRAEIDYIVENMKRFYS